MTVRVEVEASPSHDGALKKLRELRALPRLWAHDASLWSSGPEPEPEIIAAIENRLGWLEAPVLFTERVDELEALAVRLLADVDRVVLVGMGGSSLCPEVLARTLGSTVGGRPLTVIDSTNPDAIAALEASLDLSRTLFVIASKSGGTLETLSLYQAFAARVARGEAFVAITDPGSALSALAAKRHFAACLENPADIGGRFSALSGFGLLPAALLGLDLGALLDHARAQAKADGPKVDPEASPAARLAVAMVVAAKAGRDKLTLRATPALESLGAWIEQLIAESTGKAGRGIIPVDLEPEGAVHGGDRLFLTLQLEGEARVPTTPAAAPVVRVILPALEAIGGAFFLFEVATALAGVLLQVNPFDEPNVKEAKSRTADLLARFETTGVVPLPEPRIRAQGLELFADEKLVVQSGEGIEAAIAAHLDRARPGDYLALQAFLPADEVITAALQRLRARLGARAGLATTLGFGPRFLHASGQLHKGGPNTGLFVQITHRPATTREIPGAPYGFETLLLAQAAGDLAALTDRGRRVIRIDLGSTQLVAALDALMQEG